MVFTISKPGRIEGNGSWDPNCEALRREPGPPPKATARRRSIGASQHLLQPSLDAQRLALPAADAGLGRGQWKDFRPICGVQNVRERGAALGHLNHWGAHLNRRFS